ncbi:MAG: UvrB/UvrC motif-containing protein [Christensenellales bacterium]
MLCDNCLKNTASVHMTSFVNGQMQTLHLCAQCAIKKKSVAVMPWLSFNDFLSAFYDGEDAQDIKCEYCGTTLAGFKKTGKLGCAACYKVFESSIQPVLKGVHINTVHTGKRPGDVVNAAAGTEERPERNKTDELKQKLREAVAVENFEEAARLRDEIAFLEKEGK